MLQGTDLVILSAVYTLLVFIGGFLVGRRNGSKLDDIIAETPTAEATLVARVRALEDATTHLLSTHLLSTHLEGAKADTKQAVDAVKQAIVSAEIKPETIASAIEAEIKKVV